MARKKMTRRSWRETPTKEKAGAELINGRSMMAVCLLYEELEYPKREGRGTSYVQKLLRDYKDHKERVQECLPSCYEVLEEGRRRRKDPFDAELLKRVKQTIADEMGYTWEGKKRPVDKKQTAVVDVDDESEYDPEPEPQEEEKEGEESPAYEPPPDEQEQPESPEEEVDWAARFSDGEFDLE